MTANGSCTCGGEQAEFVDRLEKARYRRRVLTDGEWRVLSSFISSSRFFDLPPFGTENLDGVGYTALRLTPQGGQRVSMSDPRDYGSDGIAYDLFVRCFDGLRARATSSIRYDVLDAVPEAELVLTEPRVAAVGGADGAILVLCQTNDRSDKYDEVYAWHRLREGELEARVPQPVGWLPWEMDQIGVPFLNRSPWQSRLGDAVVFADFSALNQHTSEDEETVLKKGYYSNPLVTPDERWLFAAKKGRDGRNTLTVVVRVRLSDREEFLVDLPAAEHCLPVAWVGDQESVLLQRQEGDHSEPVFYLCAPATGTLRRVTGEFTPWLHAARHPLQRTEIAGEVWAAIPGEDETALGRYRFGDSGVSI